MVLLVVNGQHGARPINMYHKRGLEDVNDGIAKIQSSSCIALHNRCSLAVDGRSVNPRTRHIFLPSLPIELGTGILAYPNGSRPAGGQPGVALLQ